MARQSSRQRIEELLEEFEPRIRKAFLEAIDDITSNAEIARIATALERGDAEGALRALHLERGVFGKFVDALWLAFNSGGPAFVGGMPRLREPSGARLVLRFDGRNPRAEVWLREHSTTLVTAIVADQEAAIRQALVDAMMAGRNPRSTALDIVGRIDRQTQRRTGGIVGLTTAQAGYVARARAELLSGDPAQLRAYLERERRDKRFDRSVAAAIAGTKPLDAAKVARMVARYADALLLLRGETIARTEAMASLHAAQDEAFRQAVDSGAVRADQIRRVWRSAGDWRVRHSHRAMNGDSVGLNETFVAPSGARLRWPGDPTAPAAEIVNCRCHLDVRIDFLANLPRLA